MSNPIPSLLALTSIADGSAQQAAPIRNNFSAIQTADNDLIAALSGGAVGQMLRAVDATDVQWAYPPGYEYAYNQITANVPVAATTEATATPVVAASAVAFDGATVVLIEFYSANVTKGTSQTTLYLYDGAVSIGLIGLTVAASETVRTVVRLTPSAAAHTYSIRAIVDAGAGQVSAGAGGVGAVYPAFIRITKA